MAMWPRLCRQTKRMRKGSVCIVIAYHGVSLFGAVKMMKSMSCTFQHKMMHAVMSTPTVQWEKLTVIKFCGLSSKCISQILTGYNLTDYKLSANKNNDVDRI